MGSIWASSPPHDTRFAALLKRFRFSWNPLLPGLIAGVPVGEELPPIADMILLIAAVPRSHQSVPRVTFKTAFGCSNMAHEPQAASRGAAPVACIVTDVLQGGLRRNLE